MGVETGRATWTPHDLVYGLRTAATPQVSGDGTRIVYALAAADPATPEKAALSRLMTCAIDGSDAVALTDAGHRDGTPRWAPDGTRIAFVSDRGHGSGLFLVPAEGGELVELARHPLGITWLAWSPDGQSIAYTVPVDPEHEAEGPGAMVRVTRRLDYKEDVRGYLGDRRSQVYVVDVATAGTRRLTHASVDHHRPAWSPDGRTLALIVTEDVGMRSHLVLLDVAGGAAVEVAIAERGMVGLHAWSPSGERLLLAGEPGRTAQTDLYLYTVATGELQRLTEDLAVLPDAGYPNSVPPSLPVWLDESRVLIHAMHKGASGLYRFDVESKALEQLAGWQALHTGLSTDGGARYVVQGHASLESVGEISVFDRQTGQSSVVTSHNGDLLAAHVPARWERFDVERGGLTIEAWLLYPPDFDPAVRYPMVLDIHGGPHSYHGYTFNPVQQLLASSGFLVVAANPRGSGSYGRAFATRVLRDWGGEDYLDLMAVVDAVCTRPFVDPDRAGVFGYSYGGFMTSWIIGHTARFKAAVCGAPCFDLVSMYGTSDIAAVWGPIQWGAAPHEDPDWYREHSPSTYAHGATTPTLIVHGEADNRCPIGQAEEMFTALKQAGCEVELVRYPGAPHLFLRLGPAGQRQDFVARVVRWFEEHL